MSKVEFENLGYSKDFYINKSYIGSIKLSEKDREVLGYYGRRKEVVDSNLKLGNKAIKAGTEVTTELHQISGRIIK